MSAPKDGGPAFPGGSISELTDRGSAWGMSMRDYFAAAAVPALIAKKTEVEKWELLNDGEPAAVECDEDGNVRCSVPPVNSLRCDTESEIWVELSKTAYCIADALLAERNKHGGGT